MGFRPLLPVWAASALLWLTLFAILPPAQQNFPLNDDWAFARSAFIFAHGEGVQYLGWASMPQFGQWIGAWPFIRVFGENFAALRVATILFSWIGLWGFFDLLLLEGRLKPRSAAFVTAVLALSPLWVLLSGTFMNDIPALALSLAALALYTRAIRTGRRGFLGAAVLIAILGAVTRQNTVAVPLAALVLLWLSPNLRRRPLWIAGVVLPLVVAVGVDYWFRSRADVLRMPLRVPSVGRGGVALLSLLVYPGLAALPLLAFRRFAFSWRRLGFCLAAVLALMIGLFILDGSHQTNGSAEVFPYGGTFPYARNLFTPWGQLGVNTVVPGQRPLVLTPGIRWLLTAAGWFGAALLLDRLLERMRMGPRASPLLIFSLCQLPFLFVTPLLYDRYLVVLLPGALSLLAESSKSLWRWPVALVAVGLSAIISLALIHDWLSWNAARWDLGRRAVARGIAPGDIEGGLEWDGFHAPLPGVIRTPGEPPGLVMRFNRELFPHLTGRFALSFSTLPNTTIVESEPYRLWLAPGEHRFLLLEQDSAIEGSP